MKNLYSKSKPKKIYPSPSNSSSAAAAGLRLLPAAILALTAALSQDDKEVLAYLVMLSVGPTQEQSRRKRSSTSTGGGGAHAPVIGCGCFDCYTSFWSRWDQSPNRELIHAAIDAFDDHLANPEQVKNRKDTKRREKGNKGKSRKGVVVVVGPTCQQGVEVQEAVVSESVSVSGSEEEVVKDSIEGKVLEDCEKVLVGCNEEEEEERRKGYWAEVMGSMLNLRLWGIWSSAPPPPPAMETA